MQHLILHPTEAYATLRGKVRPKTHRAKAKPSAERVAQATELGLEALTVPDLRLLCRTRGLNATTKHVRAEVLKMLASGVQVRAAAQDRCNASRRKAG